MFIVSITGYNESMQVSKNGANGSASNIIRLDQVAKSFHEGEQERLIFDGVSATFDEGSIVAIVGRSGSGKSTLLNLIAGLDLPLRGEIWMGDTCVSRLNDRERTLHRRTHIGFVFQFFNLIPTLTVCENVMLPAELCGLPAREARAAAESLLAQVGLLDRANAYTDKLSGGEQQRVAIARALCANPALILADEPTGNLDADTGAQVMSLLTTLARERGKTLLLVTHSLEVAAMAGRVFRLDHGHLLEESPAALPVGVGQ